MKTVSKFLLVGGTGFATDAGGLLLMQIITDWHPIYQRIPFFILAIFVTFILHRNFTFKARDKCFWKSFFAYIPTVAIAQGTNFLVYSTLVISHSFFEYFPVLSLAVASGIAAGITYILSKHWVFKIKND